MFGQARSTQRCCSRVKDDEADLVFEFVDLAESFGRYGYRTSTGLLRLAGWHLNHKRVERIWKQEGLRVPKKQPKRSRLWLGDSDQQYTNSNQAATVLPAVDQDGGALISHAQLRRAAP